MGSYIRNEDGSYSLVFGKERSSGFGGGAIDVPANVEYNATVIEDKEVASRAAGPEGASVQRKVTVQIYEPEEVEGIACKGKKIAIFVPVPEDKADGSDKNVHFLWEGYLLAQGVTKDQYEGDDAVINITPDETIGTAVRIEVYDDTFGGKTRRKARFVGPAAVGEGTVEAAPIEEETAPAPARAAPVRTAPRAAPNGSDGAAKPAAKPAQTAQTARPAARPAARR